MNIAATKKPNAALQKSMSINVASGYNNSPVV
jgi:hypothetical protein